MADVDFIVRSKQEAKSLGLKWYFTGVPCDFGHVAERLVSNASCRICANIRSKRWRSNNLGYFTKWTEENRQHIRDQLTARRRRRGVPEGNWHGQSRTRLYRIWDAMRRRSTRKQSKACYAGVSVCPEWQSFNAFWDWSIKAGYNDSLVIDRIDSSGNYEPSNCRWTTYTENNRNRKNVKLKIEDARAIRAAVLSGRPQKDVAVQFGIHANRVSVICSGKVWKDSPT
jgi:hypothetical protein